MYWTPERVELLCKLWAEGFSARQISQQLGGISRNAVIGKAYRMKLEHGLPVEDEKPRRDRHGRRRVPARRRIVMKRWLSVRASRLTAPIVSGG